MHERYFDNAATTPVDPRVVAEMVPYFTEFPGNAATIHHYGQKARAALDLARTRVANLIGADDPMQLTFLSGSSEGNNWVLSNYRNKRVAVSPYEHSSIIKIAKRDGYTILPPFEECLPENFDIVGLMSVNNEVGTIFDTELIRKRTVSKDLLVDITQSCGKLPFDVAEIDYVTASAHKFYAPKGVGFVYQKDVNLIPYMLGGGQEFGRRGSTANVPGIVALGAAAQIAMDEMEDRIAHATHLKNVFLEEIKDIPDHKINGPGQKSPYICNVSFRGITGETLLVELDQAGFCCSAGAACSSTSNEPSSVLLALGLTPEWMKGTIRVSFGMFNTPEATQILGKTIKSIVERLRSLK
ncbi:MAG TPA: cysteine desulfurase family protein [Fimbriimonas sp.]|nr:cysteine desulfurase family protein [Fimbriimonas sp.]